MAPHKTPDDGGFDAIYKDIGLYKSHLDWIKSQEALRHVPEPVLQIIANYREGLGKGKLLEWIRPKDGDRVLDNGCGVGYFIYDLMARFPDARLTFAGIEMSENGLRLLHKRGELERKSNVLGVRGTSLGLPFPDRTFDFVLCSEVLDHIPSPADAIKEMARVLRPGGRLLMTVPNGRAEGFWDGLRGVARKIQGRKEEEQPYFEARLELSDVKAWISAAGLQIRRSDLNTALPLGTLVRLFPTFLQKAAAVTLVAIEPLLRFEQFATNFVVLAEKG